MTKLSISISSRAMFGTYCWSRPTRTLFDAGSGLTRDMLTELFAVECLMCSHGHQDHLGDIPSLIGLRAKMKGDTTKPLHIYYPFDNRQFQLMKRYIEESWTSLPYSLFWHPIEPSFTLQLGKSHRIEAFEMKHQKNATTLGYRVVEERKRLTSKWRDIVTGAVKLEEGSAASSKSSSKEVGQMLAAARQAGEQVDEIFHASTFVYLTDFYEVDPANIAGADLVVADCTFLSTAERDEHDKAHSSLEESARLCKAAGVKRMIAAHISIRNRMDDVVKRAAELEIELDMPIVVCHPDRILEL